MKLDEILRKLLKTNGMTTTSLSKKSKVPLQTINNWLAKGNPKNFTQVKAVADVFGVSLDYLVFGIEQEKVKIEDLVAFGNFDVFLKRNK